MSLKFINIFKKFRSDTDGSMSVEAVLVFPLLLWGITATFVFFDVYKEQNNTYRANYTISDVLSRETNAIDNDYTEGLFKVFKYMTDATDTNSWLRISVINCQSDCSDEDLRVLQFDWSHGENGAVDFVDDDMNLITDYLPVFSEGDRLILVQTSTDYEAPFSSVFTGFDDRTLVTNIVTRPRFAPQLIWEGTSSSGVDEDDTPDA